MDINKPDSALQSAFIKFNHIKDCRYGKMIYNIHDMYMGKALDLYGEYSQSEIDIFDTFLTTGNVVLDIGANIGCHTLYYAEKVGTQGLVVAFEPQRIVYQTLCANIALNSITNTYCEHLALGEKAGHCYLPPINYHSESNFGAISLNAFQSLDQGELVAIRNLDSFNLPRCDLIKIDVEGMETPVIKGGINNIKKHKPILFVENDRIEKSKELITLIMELGYDLFWAITPLYNPNNFLKNTKNIYNRTVSVNMLCFPKGHSHVSITERLKLPKIMDVNETFQTYLQQHT